MTQAEIGKPCSDVRKITVVVLVLVLDEELML